MAVIACGGAAVSFERARHRRLTRDSRNRRLTRDFRNRRLTRDSLIPSPFFRKKFRKIRKINFSDSQDQNKILNFLICVNFLYMASISYINPYFRAPSPLKPLKSSPRSQNLPGFLLAAHSDHRGPVSAQFCGLCCLFLTFVSFMRLS